MSFFKKLVHSYKKTFLLLLCLQHPFQFLIRYFVQGRGCNLNLSVDIGNQDQFFVIMVKSFLEHGKNEILNKIYFLSIVSDMIYLGRFFTSSYIFAR